MLALPDVTLVCADTLNHALAVRALARCCERIRYGRALFLTDLSERPARLPRDVEIEDASRRSSSRDAYSTLMLKGLASHVETSHALVVQWDGHVVNRTPGPTNSSHCDYCGAPWPWGPTTAASATAASRCVRAGSRRARLVRRSCSSGNEDETIGVHSRAWLETDHGIRYASEDLASRFSFEVAYPAARPFGFHGLFNFCRVLPEDEIAALAPGFPDAIARSPQLLSLMRNCAAMGQWRAALAIAYAHARGRRRACRSAPRCATMRPRSAVAAAAAVGRNDPCPCGSGKRYKQCHGVLSAAAARRRRTRTPTREGIERTGGPVDEAERAYAAALAIAPGPSLRGSHFLGVIAMQRQRLDERDAAARARRRGAPRRAGFPRQPRTGVRGRRPVRRRDRRASTCARGPAGPRDARGTNVGLAFQRNQSPRRSDRRLPARAGPRPGVHARALEPRDGPARARRTRRVAGLRSAPRDSRARWRRPSIRAFRDTGAATFAA